MSEETEVEWYTPQPVLVMAEWVVGKAFDLDPCSAPEAPAWGMVKKSYTVDENGLDQRWGGNIWLNPPYVRYLTDKWVQRGVREVQRGSARSVMMLLRSGVSGWYYDVLSHPLCFGAAFFKQRIRFVAGNGQNDKHPRFDNQLLLVIGPGQAEKTGAHLRFLQLPNHLDVHVYTNPMWGKYY